MVELTLETMTWSCQLLKPRVENPLKILQGKSKSTKDMSLLEPINPPITWLIGEPMEAGADMKILQKPDRKINIVGVDNHELTGLDVVTAAVLSDTQKGPVIRCSMNMHTLEKGTSIHAAGQMEWFNWKS